MTPWSQSNRAAARWLTRDEVQLRALQALVHADGPVEALGLLAGAGATDLDKEARKLIKHLMDVDHAETFG